MAGRKPQLFLDCDGVLADFDAGARALLGTDPATFQARHGSGEFWKRLARAGNFYGDLPEMADARLLFEAVRHLDPTILTGLPLGKWAAPQKERWAAAHFPGVPIITTMAKQKHLHMQGGDVLVDDRENHRHLWEDAGGVFVHHKNAGDTIRQLAQIYPSVKAAAKSYAAAAGLCCGCGPMLRLRECRLSRPTPARTPAHGSTTPERSRRFR